MDSDQKFWVRICGMLLLVFTLLVGMCCIYGYYQNKQYILNGYEKKMLIGHQYSTWQKVK